MNASSRGMSVMLALACITSGLVGCSHFKKSEQKEPIAELAKIPYLDSLEILFANVPQWISTVYDSSSGGFYHNALMVDDPTYTADLQSTTFALNVLFNGKIVPGDSIAEKFKNGLKQFVFQRYDASEDLYLDPVYKNELLKSERNLARVQNMAASILKYIDVENIHAKPLDPDKTPAHLQSLRAFESWLKNEKWDRVWTAFDHIAMQTALIRRLPKSRADSIIRYVEKFALEIQNEDGLWGKGQAIEIRFSGAAKYGTFCQNFDIELPNADLIYATLINWLQYNQTLDFGAYSGCEICVPRNALRLLYYVKPHLSNPDIVKNDQELIVKQATAMLAFYHNKDGGFMKNHTRSDIAPDDIKYGTYDSLVSDMNGTHLAITTRSAIYDLLDLPVPVIPAEHEDIKLFSGIR